MDLCSLSMEIHYQAGVDAPNAVNMKQCELIEFSAFDGSMLNHENIQKLIKTSEAITTHGKSEPPNYDDGFPQGYCPMGQRAQRVPRTSLMESNFRANKTRLLRSAGGIPAVGKGIEGQASPLSFDPLGAGAFEDGKRAAKETFVARALSPFSLATGGNRFSSTTPATPFRVRAGLVEVCRSAARAFLRTSAGIEPAIPAP